MKFALRRKLVMGVSSLMMSCATVWAFCLPFWTSAGLIVFFLAALYVSLIAVHTAWQELEPKVIKWLVVISVFTGLLLVLATPFPTEITEMEITATGEKNAASLGSEIWINEVQADGVKQDLAKITLYKGWAMQQENLVYSGSKPSTITWRMPNVREVTLSFGRHNYSGTVKIIAGGVETQADLYSSVGNQRNAVVIPIKEGATWQSWVLFFFHWLFVSSLLSGLGVWLMRRPLEGSLKRLKWWHFFWPGIGAWLLYLAAFYPGLMTSDSLDQWNQLRSFAFHNHHPAIHTLTNWLITRIWLSPAAIAVVQIVSLGAVYALALQLCCRYGVQRKLVTAVFLFFVMLWPANGFLVITLWKDVLHSVALLWLTVLAAELVLHGECWLDVKRNFCMLVIAFLVVLFYRHNGIVAVAGTMLGMMFFYSKRFFRIGKMALVIAVIFFLVKGPVYTCLAVHPAAGHLVFSLPLHQVGAMLQREVPLAEEEAVFLENILPKNEWKVIYNPYIVDSIVLHPTINIDFLVAHKSEFLQVWGNLIYRNPNIAGEHWLHLTSILWRIIPYADGYTATTVDRILYYDWADPSLKSESLLPELKDTFLEIKEGTERRESVGFFWRPALYIYSSLFFGAIFALKQGRRGLLVLMPLLFNCLSLIISIPAQDVRYMYAATLIAPFVFLLSCISSKEKKLR